MTNFRNLLRISRPLLLLDAVLVYFLGVGIARYLGAAVDADIFTLGLAWVLSLQLGAHYLYAYSGKPTLLSPRLRSVPWILKMKKVASDGLIKICLCGLQSQR